MKKNVGTLDAYSRLTLGFTLFGIGLSKKSNPLIILGSMKLAEGITKYCPTYDLLDISTNRKREKFIVSVSRQ